MWRLGAGEDKVESEDDFLARLRKSLHGTYDGVFALRHGASMKNVGSDSLIGFDISPFFHHDGQLQVFPFGMMLLSQLVESFGDADGTVEIVEEGAKIPSGPDACEGCLVNIAVGIFAKLSDDRGATVVCKQSQHTGQGFLLAGIEQHDVVFLQSFVQIGHCANLVSPVGEAATDDVGAAQRGVVDIVKMITVHLTISFRVARCPAIDLRTVENVYLAGDALHCGCLGVAFDALSGSHAMRHRVVGDDEQAGPHITSKLFEGFS